MWYGSDAENNAIQKLIDEFNAENPDVNVELAIVPFADVDQLLTTQATGGQAPDLTRISSVYKFQQYLLDLRPHLSDQNFLENFLENDRQITTGPNGEVYGFKHSMTYNGPFVNVSLFEQAGVPLPTSDEVSWEEWMSLATQVQQATGVPYAAAIDRSQSRTLGFIHALGGSYFTEDGSAANITSPETRQAAEYFVDLFQNGTMALEVWAGSGTGYADAKDLFMNGQIVFYMSGNWQVATFEENIKDFEWKAVPNPCDVRCGNAPGGAYVIAFKNTQAPDKVARLIEFLGSKEKQAQFVTETMLLPSRIDLVQEANIQYPARSEDMNTFIQDINRMPESIVVDFYHPVGGPVMTEVRDRLVQAIVGEMSLDAALEAAQQRTEELLSQQ
jgi:alpha-1,4-digalacturonate transport system substrate-binding protein